jgi:hypothetical protein
MAGLLLVLSLMPKNVAAQEPPRFLIESIRVAGTQRVAAGRIVTDESLLKPGQTYSEQELRQAVYRVKRLPFIIDAELSLEKGSERGAYELVITVEEQKPLFFSAWADAYRFRHEVFNGRPYYTTYWQETASLGGRYFVGSHGLLFGNVEKIKGADGESLQAGYTQYDIFGKGSFASLQVATQQGVPDQEYDQTALAAGIPLSSTQSLRTNLSWYRQESVTRFVDPQDPANVQRSEYRATVRSAQESWIYDTTDDPLFPDSGTRLAAGAGYSSARADERSSSPFGDFARTSKESDTIAFLSGFHSVPLTQRQSLRLALDNSYLWRSFEGFPEERTYQVSALIGHSLSLLGQAKTERFGDLRFENGIQATYVRTSGGYQRSGMTGQLMSSLIYRNPWGLLRVSFTYYDLWSTF